MSGREEKFWAALRAAGMPEAPERFSVIPFSQKVDRETLQEIANFIRTFNRITTRKIWQEKVTFDNPPIARFPRPEVCFFSAWDFHLPTGHPEDWQLIEFNDNGSGLLLAGVINAIFYELAPESVRLCLQTPPTVVALSEWIAKLVMEEAQRFFGTFPQGGFSILDDAQSLQTGKFRSELRLMRDWWQQRGWPVAIAAPEETTWDGRQLLVKGQEVQLPINRW